MLAPTFTTSAYVLHNLGLAAGFGGSLFGQTALNPSVKLISNKQERAKIVNAAWNGFNIISMLGIGTTALTWFAGRSRIDGRAISSDARKLVIAKDVLLGVTLITGLVNTVTGGFLAKRSLKDGVPMDSGFKAAPEAPQDVQRATTLVNSLGVVSIIAMAGLIGVSTWLDNTAAKSFKWNALARFLP